MAIVALYGNRKSCKICVAAEGFVWQQKALCGNRKSCKICVAAEGFVWQQKALNRKGLGTVIAH